MDSKADDQPGTGTEIDPKQIADILKKSNNIQWVWSKFAKDPDTTSIGVLELFKMLYSMNALVLQTQNPSGPRQKPPAGPIKKMAVALIRKMPKKDGKNVMEKTYFENELCDALYALSDEMNQENGKDSDGL